MEGREKQHESHTLDEWGTGTILLEKNQQWQGQKNSMNFTQWKCVAQAECFFKKSGSGRDQGQRQDTTCMH